MHTHTFCTPTDIVEVSESIYVNDVDETGSDELFSSIRSEDSVKHPVSF